MTLGRPGPSNIAKLLCPPLPFGAAMRRATGAERKKTVQGEFRIDANDGALDQPDGPIVMVIDDDVLTGQAWAGDLGNEGFATVFSSALDETATLSLIEQVRPHVILLDRNFGAGDSHGGDRLAERIRTLAKRLVGYAPYIILFTKYPRDRAVVEQRQLVDEVVDRDPEKTSLRDLVAHVDVAFKRIGQERIPFERFARQILLGGEGYRRAWLCEPHSGTCRDQTAHPLPNVVLQGYQRGVFAVLARNYNRPVSKDALITEVIGEWGDADQRLMDCVSELRKCLRDRMDFKDDLDRILPKAQSGSYTLHAIVV